MLLRVPVLIWAFAAVCFAAGVWPMFGGNPQRDGWQRQETLITPANAGNIKLKWKLHLASVPREMNNLTAPVVASVQTPEGPRTLVVVAGASDTVDVIDAASGKLRWHEAFKTRGSTAQKPSWLCPDALNATPVVDDDVVHLVTSDGKLHSLKLVNGKEDALPVQFVPPFAKVWSLALSGDVIYTAASQSCGGASAGVYSADVEDPRRPVHFFESAPMGAGIWGRAGVALGMDDAVWAATGDGEGSYSNSVLHLTTRILQLKDYFAPTSKALDMGSISPVVFPFQDSEMIAAAGKEGRIYLLDAQAKPLYESPVLVNQPGFWGAFASWQDAGGVRWLIAPAWGAVPGKEGGHGSLMAFRMEKQADGPVLVPAWTSRDMAMPEPPVIAGGVVFAVSSGEQAAQTDKSGRVLSSSARIKAAPGYAVLFGFDAATGQELFNSSNMITGVAHMSGLAVANGTVYVTTFDGNLYAFGVDGQ